MRLIDAGALYTKLMHDWDTMDSEEFEKAVFRRLTNAPTIGGWIPCSERMPEKHTRCLVTWKSMFHTIEIDVAKYGRMFLSERKGLGFYLHGSDVDADITDEVIAWMPLPEPYFKTETTTERRNDE